jgi:hypothetical protein
MVGQKEKNVIMAEIGSCSTLPSYFVFLSVKITDEPVPNEVKNSKAQ